LDDRFLRAYTPKILQKLLLLDELEMDTEKEHVKENKYKLILDHLLWVLLSEE
jgi:hypothetical protein